MEPITNGAVLATALVIALGLVEAVKALVAKIGNGRKNGTTKVTAVVAEMKAGVLAIHQQVKDRDGVPLSFHMRQHTEILRAMLSRMEHMATNQNETAHILKKLEECNRK